MKVFIADDSILIRNVVRELLSSDPTITIVGTASNGADAVDGVLSLEPDIVIMDIDMPIMNGLEATALIAGASSIPVLVFTHNTDPKLPYKALECGAVDFLLKPDFNDLNRPDYVGTFIARLKALSARTVSRPSRGEFRGQTGLPNPPRAGMAPASPSTEPNRAPPIPGFPEPLPSASIIVVGASTGGPQAVSKFLRGLKAPFPLPIVLVQHIETGFDKGYADWLCEETGHRVVLARQGDRPQAGIVHVAPTDFHILISDSRFVLSDSQKVLNQKPSVDVLFRSAAAYYGVKALAVLLTGMGSDGAEGCASIRSRGGYTVVQDEASSLIFGMPKAAIALGAASLVLPLERIGPFVSAVAGVHP